MVNGMTREHLHSQCSISEATFTPCLTAIPYSRGNCSLSSQMVLLLFIVDDELWKYYKTLKLDCQVIQSE